MDTANPTLTPAGTRCSTRELRGAAGSAAVSDPQKRSRYLRIPRRITQEYLSYLDVIKELNLETAGEFLVMASTLMQIKAQMLLPQPGGGKPPKGRTRAKS